jgi:predicted nucleotidyltransferase
MDLYGFCIPPKDVVFPHLAGEIHGFGKQIQRFEQFQQHHIIEKDHNKEYDINIYNIVKYFQLVMENNPNMIDSLFTAQNHVIQCTKLANHVRDNRKLFLHKGCWHKFRGYAYSQMHKMKIKEPDIHSKRYASIQEHGYDVKFAYHVVRLLNEVEQILMEEDLDLQRNHEQLKEIRRGGWTMQQIEDHFALKERALGQAYHDSKLRHTADEETIKKILLEVLEEHYGTLDGAIETKDHYHGILRQVQKLVEKI